jgi:hypothetical protein
MTEWISKNKRSIIRSTFLVPIFAVAAISISHVVSWYDLANPISWAICLSIAVEVAAMSAIAAASVKVKGFSVWFVFVIVTLIQFIGNIFFCYTEIDVSSKSFVDWAELTAPLFEALGNDLSDVVSQRRFLALLEGGLLPLISLTCLHFFIQYGDQDEVGVPDISPQQEEQVDSNYEEVGPSEIVLDLQEDQASRSTIKNVQVETKETVNSESSQKPINKKSRAQVLSEKMKKIYRR